MESLSVTKPIISTDGKDAAKSRGARHSVLTTFVKVNNNSALTRDAGHLSLRSESDPNWFCKRLSPQDTIMRKSIVAAFVAAAGMAVPSLAQAGCTTCYQPQVIPPQYRTVERTVMVSPGHTIRRHRPAQYRTVMVPKTVMVAPPRTEYRRVPAQYATTQRTVQVAPAQVYYAPVQTGCSTCGRNGFNFGSSYGGHGYSGYGHGASYGGYGYGASYGGYGY
jgi:hypothetical protein